MSTDLDWSRLPRLAAQDRPTISRPFPTHVNGERVTCATNGHAMIVVRSDLGFPVLAGSPDITKIVADAEAGVERHPVSLSALRSFLGIAPPDEPDDACEKCNGEREIECTWCGGTGEAECECRCGDIHDGECEECDGTGKVECDCRPSGRKMEPVRLFGRAFNASVVRQALAALPYDGAAEWRSPESAEHAHAIVGDGWTLLLMPVRDDVFEGRRSFPAAAVGAA